MGAQWGPLYDAALGLIKDKAPRETLRAAIDQLPDPDVFHTWRDAKFNLLFHSVLENNIMAFELLLKRGANPSLCNDRGTNILHLLMKRNLRDWADLCVKTMDAKQKNIFVNNGQRNGWTSLMSAAENNHLEACQWLLANGANVNFTMDTGWTAMHAASKKGNRDILELFLKHGGDKNLEAAHRDFGRNLKVEDVTVDRKILKLLEKY